MTHHGHGVVLKTLHDAKNNKVVRTVFERKSLRYQTITDYVPPLFLMVNYEGTASTRVCYGGGGGERQPSPTGRHGVGMDTPKTRGPTGGGGGGRQLMTDGMLEENVGFVGALLEAADCRWEAFQMTFLRLEVVGDLQRNFGQLYPLWNVGIGALVRLTFASWAKRSRALTVLVTNAGNNQDVFSVCYAANQTVATLVDYMEPLFAYCVRLERRDGRPSIATALPAAAVVAAASGSPSHHDAPTKGGRKRTCPSVSSLSSPSVAASSAAASVEVFEIDFCVAEEPPDAHEADGAAPPPPPPLRPTATKRARGVGGGAARVTAEAHDRVRQAAALVTERPRAMCAPLTAHDVRPYFSALQARRVSRVSVDQLDDLPVVAVRCERDFCATACCVLDRTENVPTVMHVYYCWDREVHGLLAEFAAYCGGTDRAATCQVMVAVSPPCGEDVEARLRMLDDLKDVIWKNDENVYVRLAVDDDHDRDMVARNFYEPLLFATQRSSADLETEIRCSVRSSMAASGGRDVFRNAVTLDCKRLCGVLAADDNNFARAYNSLLDDPSTFTANGRVRLGGGGGGRTDLFRLMHRTHDVYTRLVSEFRSERVLDAAFDVANELRLGLLDLFGLAYTDAHATDRHAGGPSGRAAGSDGGGDAACGVGGSRANDRAGADGVGGVLDALRVSNCLFVETLVECSLYFGNTGSASACSEFFAKEKDVKPLAQHRPNVYRYDAMELDLRSAYPSVAVLYNVSPETTAIVDRGLLKRLDDGLEAFVGGGVVAAEATPSDATAATDRKRPRRDRIMTSIYYQVGHVNEICSNLVVVSLRPEIYTGVMARYMEKLVLRRVSRRRTLDAFYKSLANRVYGCTGRSTPFNDLFSPHCGSAIRSLCKLVMLRTLQDVPPESVVLTQTDGAILYLGQHGETDGETTSWIPATSAATTTATTDTAVTPSRPTCADVERTVRTAIDAVVADAQNYTSSVRIVPRIRSVDTCFIVDHNTHLILYSDGRTSCKGGRRLYGGRRHVGAPAAENGLTDHVVSVIASYIRDRFGRTDDAARELNGFVNACLNSVEEYDANTRRSVEWYVTARVPNASHRPLNQRCQADLTGFRLGGVASTRRQRLEDLSTAATTTTTTTSGGGGEVARFGDTVAVWPVLVNSGGEAMREVRVSRPAYNDSVLPNHVRVVRPLIEYWATRLFGVTYPGLRDNEMARFFNAICARRERITCGVEASLTVVTATP